MTPHSPARPRKPYNRAHAPLHWPRCCHSSLASALARQERRLLSFVAGALLVDLRPWRRDSASRARRAAATTSGWISATACRTAPCPPSARLVVTITSSASTTAKRCVSVSASQGLSISAGGFRVVDAHTAVECVYFTMPCGDEYLVGCLWCDWRAR